MKAEIGIIGGSGLYSMPGFEAQQEIFIETPFGPPSDSYVLGKLGGRQVAFLARHGRGHAISPSELNFRANIYGMKRLGVERILSLSAVGSLQEHHRPLDFVIPDQFFDRTRGRVSTRMVPPDSNIATSRRPTLPSKRYFANALSTWSWKAACMRMCHSGVTSWAVRNSPLRSSGASTS